MRLRRSLIRVKAMVLSSTFWTVDWVLESMPLEVVSYIFLLVNPTCHIISEKILKSHQMASGRVFAPVQSPIYIFPSRSKIRNLVYDRFNCITKRKKKQAEACSSSNDVQSGVYVCYARCFPCHAPPIQKSLRTRD